MIGTLINIAGVAIGGLLGTRLGSKMPERLSQTVVVGLGLFVVGLGLQMFLKTQNSLVVAGSLLVGAMLGEWWQIEKRLRDLGAWLEKVIVGDRSMAKTGFVRGFLTSSLVFCIGPMAILGSIQDGLKGDYQVLAIKAILDTFASLAFGSSLGIGVVFSVLPLLIYQGGITLLAAQVQSVVTPEMMNEMTATGGLILVGLAISSLLEIKPIRAGNFLPALIIAPLVVWILARIGAM
ncbi:MAG TPA: DUF554 domain-containing protein [Anaerolineaceae bacterium]|nr:DUF554 domain-containing protein [Anaerolineaceae bacterium]